MKKLVIGSLVAAILMFGWQAASWMVMQLHDKSYLYTPAQDSLLNTMKNSFTDEGEYHLPGMAPNTTQEQMEVQLKAQVGKPWAMVTWHKSYQYDMPMSIIKGFMISLICSVLLCFIIARFAVKNFWSILWTALAMGFACFLFVWYNGHVWIQTPWAVLNPELIDDLVSWGLAGVWLGWWYSRGEKA